MTEIRANKKFPVRPQGWMDKGDIHPERRLFRKDQGTRLLEEKEYQGGHGRSLGEISQREKD